MNVNLKSLIGRLNDTCRSALEGAAGLCLSRTNYDVEIEHYLIKLLEAHDADLQRILNHFEVGMARLNRDLTRALDRLKTGNARTPALSPRLPVLVQEAWLLASVEFGAAKVRSGHLLMALLGNDDLGRLAVDISHEFAQSIHDRPDSQGARGKDRSCAGARFRGSPDRGHPDPPPPEQSDPDRRSGRRQNRRRRRLRAARRPRGRARSA